jgi:hypothetical protein
VIATKRNLARFIKLNCSSTTNCSLQIAVEQQLQLPLHSTATNMLVRQTSHCPMPRGRLAAQPCAAVCLRSEQVPYARSEPTACCEPRCSPHHLYDAFCSGFFNSNSSCTNGIFFRTNYRTGEIVRGFCESASPSLFHLPHDYPAQTQSPEHNADRANQINPSCGPFDGLVLMGFVGEWHSQLGSGDFVDTAQKV